MYLIACFLHHFLLSPSFLSFIQCDEIIILNHYQAPSSRSRCPGLTYQWLLDGRAKKPKRDLDKYQEWPLISMEMPSSSTEETEPGMLKLSKGKEYKRIL